MNDRAAQAIVPCTKSSSALNSRLTGGVFVPGRRMWEELMDGQKSVFVRLEGGSKGADHDALDGFRVQMQDRFLPVLRAQEKVARACGTPITDAGNPYPGKAGQLLAETRRS